MLRREEALRQWHKNKDVRGGAPDRVQASPPDDQTNGADGDEGGAEGYRAEQERKARAQADKLELDLARLRDELRPKAQVVEGVTACFRKVRDALGRLPNHADELALACDGDPAKLKQALRVLAPQLQEAAAEAVATLLETDEKPNA